MLRCIAVYINHRPVFGLSFDKLRWAFEKLGLVNSEDGSLSIEHDVLLDLLQTKGVLCSRAFAIHPLLYCTATHCTASVSGEHMSEEELAESLVTLLGFLPEGGRGERDPAPAAGIAGELASSARSAGAADVTTLLDRHLPYQVTLDHFVTGLLGLRLPEHLRGTAQAAPDASVAGGQDTKRSKKNAAGGGSERRSSRASSTAASKGAENGSNSNANAKTGRPNTSSVAVST